MKTYKVIYSEDNKPGQRVMFVQANDPFSARLNAERDLTGTWGSFNCKYTFWEVTEVN